jgi:diadenosine tetraphosphate (Ap4A) HIT family hydrolase
MLTDWCQRNRVKFPPQTVIKFACANLPPVWRAADAGCWAVSTGDFSETEYLELQRLVFRIAQGVRQVLSPERIYILSLGSQAANSHVHWHIAPLPSGGPLEQQQYHAVMHENGVVKVTHREQLEFARKLREVIKHAH